MEFKGLYVATVTPFKNSKVDYEGYKRNIDFLIKNGVAGIVPCGTTGESPTLSWEEHNKVVKTAITHAKKRVQVIAGAGSNNTSEAVEAAKNAQKAGADAVLVITPYYNKPNQEGLFKHFEKVSNSINIPIVVYNVPGRTGVNLLPETLERMCALKNIKAIKEASGNITQMMEIKRRCGDRIALLSGDDAIALPVLSVGGTGVISVVGNIAPKELSTMINLYLSGKTTEALDLSMKLYNLSQSMFIDTNPAPVKTAMNLMGLAAGELRLPMVEVSDATKKKIVAELKAFGIKI